MCYASFEPSWRAPKYAEEEAELLRVVTELGVPMDRLREAFRAGDLVDLPLWMWCSLDNTDSNDTFTLAEAEARAKLYDRDLSRIIQGMSQRATLPAPIILAQGQKRPHLVAGNTRLMACRVLNIRPKVWLMTLEGSGGA